MKICNCCIALIYSPMDYYVNDDISMTINDIKKLIASDESRTLELKKTTGELKDGMHSACAFLNTEGGWLLFGVAPLAIALFCRL